MKTKICGIYKITSPTGRIYIGQSKDIKTRWRYYGYLKITKNQHKIYRSFLKHGIKNHTFEIIEECSIDILNNRERYYQEYYDSVISGLNCVYVRTDENPNVMTDLIKDKLREANLGKKHTKETRLKMSKSRLGDKNPNYGVVMSKEQRAKLSIAHKGKKLSESHKIKLSEVRVGIKSLGKHHNAKKVINIDTNEIYSCAKEVSLLFDIKYYLLKSWLKIERRNKTPFRYL